MARTKSNEISLKKVIDLTLKEKDLATSLKISKEQVEAITSSNLFKKALEKAKEEAAKITFFLVDDINENGKKEELVVNTSSNVPTLPKPRKAGGGRKAKSKEVIEEALKISPKAKKAIVK